MPKQRRPMMVFVIFFFMTNALFITGRSFLEQRNIQQEVVIIGNLILCAATMLSFLIAVRSHRSNTGAAAVRGLYGSFMIKFFLIAVSAFVYIIVAGKGVNKNGLLVCAVLYVVYTVMEVRLQTRLLRENKNV